MKSTGLLLLGATMGISLGNADPLQAPKLGPSINSAVSASESFPPQEYMAAFRRGALYACNQPERATRRYADMLQANCVAADLSAGIDWSETRRRCFGAEQRSTFIRKAEETCAALSSFPGFLLARDGKYP
jgi:hypothetical protein